jgi:geranylgeranyl diphosphate synthase type I
MLSPAVKIVSAVNAAIDQVMEERANALRALSSHAPRLMEPIVRMTAGGKRTRALATWWGFEIGQGSSATTPGIERIAASVELFHAAALIHDDIIDGSETRRGMPAVHAEFRSEHRAAGAGGSSERYGVSAAVIAGDLCLSLSEQLYAASGLPTLGDAGVLAAHDEFRQEVMLGQYLDLRLEATPVAAADIEAAALEVLTLKSAKYSVEQPFVLGAALAGAPAELLEGLSGFGLPLGRAFQMRDDVLGIFGDPAVTGKPAGDDLVEGKKTVLVGLALEALDRQESDWFLARLGGSDLTPQELSRMTALLRDSGALGALEARIDAEYDSAMAALDLLGLDPADDRLLRTYARQLVRREV